MIAQAGLLVVSFFALLQDIWIHKVKNWYILLALSVGLIYQFFLGNGLEGILGAAAGMLFYRLFMLRFMGAGDVKMFCVIGAWAAFPRIFMLMAYCVLVNGVVAFFIMVMRKNGKRILYHFWLWLKTCFLLQGYTPMVEETDHSDKYPYMIGVFLGAIVFCAVGG